MKRLLTIIVCGLFAASLGMAQETDKTKPAAPPDPAGLITAPASTTDDAKGKTVAPVAEVKATLPALTVAQIMAKNRAAVGSSFAQSKVANIVATGSMELPMGATGTVEVYSQAPNKQLTIIKITGYGEITEGYDGVEAWANDPMSGIRIKSGIELAQAKAGAIFDRDAMLEKLYPKMEAKGTEKVEGRDAYVVVATSSDAGTETWYFDAQTFLLIRQDVVAEGPQGKLPLQNYFGDFRVVAGVKVPFVSRVTNPSFTATLRLSEIKTNVTIDEAKFSKPAPAVKPAAAAKPAQ